MSDFKLFFFIVSVVFMVACHSKNQNQNDKAVPPDSIKIENKGIDKFPELLSGEYELDEDCFGDVKELKGNQKNTEAIFEVGETQMLVIDSLLIMANLNNRNLFMAFSLLDFQLIKSFGKWGRGPGEFQYPQLVPAENSDCLCYIYEKANNNMFVLKKDFTISELPYNLVDGRTSQPINDKQIVSLSPNEFVYAESIKGGKGIFSFGIQNDSVRNEMIYNLSFSSSHKSWASYIGDFGANKQKNRAVYAYKYFKRLVFVDLKNNTSRTMIFDSGEAKKGNAVSVMSPENVTHYWGMSAQNDFVYVLYSGRTPVDVTKEWSKKEYYIFVEKFDWNGSPIAKYKLDNWGYFCVNEQHQKLYLASVNDAQPFFEYNLN